MKANKFVKKFGWGAIQVVIANTDSIATHIKVYKHDTILIDYIHWDGLRISIKENGEWIRLSRKYQNAPDFICINDLKRLVESHELVDRVISDHNKSFKECQIDIYGLKSFVKKNPKIYPKRLKQAIVDVESCM